MDSLDLKILAILASNGRTPFSEIAEKIGLSGPSTADRVRRLEERGAIRGYSAKLDPAALGVGLTAFVAVTLGSPGDRAGFLRGLEGMADVVECHHIAGDDDYLLKVHVDGTLGLERFVSESLKSLDGVVRTRTTVVLSTQLDRALAPPNAAG